MVRHRELTLSPQRTLWHDRKSHPLTLASEIDLPQVAAQKAKLDAVVDYGSVSRSAWMANYAPGFRAVNQWQALMYAA
jgi:hypothetical protein